MYGSTPKNMSIYKPNSIYGTFDEAFDINW